MTTKNKWLIGIGSLLAIVTSILLIRKNWCEENPPKDAPQLDVTNPGTQDEFLSAPDTSEIG
jgi:hypothetical protein